MRSKPEFEEPPDVDVRQLERQLEAVRQDPASGVLVQILERRLKTLRSEHRKLIWELAHQHAPVLRVLATRLVGSPEADDVAQEAFLSLLRWVQARPASEVQALLDSQNGVQRMLVRFTSCRAYDLLRQRAHRREQLTASGDESELRGTTAAALPQYLAVDIARLERAYAALPPAQRIVHVLHHYYGFTDSDFEETLGLSKANSRTLAHRARMALKAAMGRQQ
jgi:RNA polymerase sigma factor (sigma-70 family)